MGELDGYKYPDRKVEDIVEVADILVNEFGEEPSSEETFAQELGHASKKSGSYKQKIADARKFGILPSRGLNPTDLAFRIANPEDEIKENEAMFEMYQNISLLSTLYDHLNGKESPPEFWRILTEISEANPAEAKDVSTEIRSLYRQMLQYELKESPQPGKDEKHGSEDTEVVDETHTVPPTNPQSKDSILIQVGGDTLHLEDVSVMNLQLAISMLKQKKQQIQRNEPSSAEEQAEGDSKTSLTQF